MLSALERELYYLPLDFSAITVESIQYHTSLVEQLYRCTYDQIAAMNNSPEEINFRTVVQPLLNLRIIISKAMCLCEFPKEIHVDGVVREASAEAVKKISNLSIRCKQRTDVFQVLRCYDEGMYQAEQSELSIEKNQYVKELLLDYKRCGMYLQDPLLTSRIMEINQQISALSIEFCHNVSEENTSFIFTKEELVGLPEDWFTHDREVSPGHYKVTLKYPDYFPVLDYADNRAVREKIFIAFYQRAEAENLPKLKEILKLRNELAQILGYKTYADYAAEENRMAANSASIKTFLDEMNTHFTPLLEDNLKVLTALAREKEGDPDFQLQHYDMRYYMCLREKVIGQIDLQQLKDYFPQKKVIAGTLQIYERLLGLRFIEKQNPNRWHSDVTYYEVFDADETTGELGEILGGFYLDLYPREGKYSHAAAFPLQNGCDISPITGVEGQRQLTFCAMICNFPKEANLDFDEVASTFFHEFGHVMHFMCAKPELESNAAAFTETDFIEAPSQMLENWCYEPVVMSFLSEHADTKEPLPDAIAQKLKQQDKTHAGYTYKRQLSLGYFDFLIHSLSAEELETIDLKQFFNHLQSEIMQLPVLEETCLPACFDHIVGGYEVGYYGYLWSHTYAADMYSSAFQGDPLSREMGAKYRKSILEPGASKKGMDMLTEFLGRAPIVDAFIQSYTQTKCAPVHARGEMGFFAVLDHNLVSEDTLTEVSIIAP